MNGRINIECIDRVICVGRLTVRDDEYTAEPTARRVGDGLLQGVNSAGFVLTAERDDFCFDVVERLNFLLKLCGGISRHKCSVIK